MSRGISKAQQTILDLLSRRVPCQRVAFTGGRLDTSELLAELCEVGVMRDNQSRKHAMATVVRACNSLCCRGLLEGEYTLDMTNVGRRTIFWGLPRELKE